MTCLSRKSGSKLQFSSINAKCPRQFCPGILHRFLRQDYCERNKKQRLRYYFQPAQPTEPPACFAQPMPTECCRCGRRVQHSSGWACRPKLMECPGIRHQFGLPAVVRLILHESTRVCSSHCPLGVPGGHLSADQRILNFGGPVRIDSPLLSKWLTCFLLAFLEETIS